jgi:hypothetical protein
MEAIQQTELQRINAAIDAALAAQPSDESIHSGAQRVYNKLRQSVPSDALTAQFAIASLLLARKALALHADLLAELDARKTA